MAITALTLTPEAEESRTGGQPEVQSKTLSIDTAIQTDRYTIDLYNNLFQNVFNDFSLNTKMNVILSFATWIKWKTVHKVKSPSTNWALSNLLRSFKSIQAVCGTLQTGCLVTCFFKAMIHD